MNRINYCEAKPLAISDLMMIFLRKDDGLALYQHLTGLQLTPAHDPEQSIPGLHHQQINIKIH